MKGIVFDLLEQVVVEKYGDETWESLLMTTGLEGAYTAVGNYPDEDLAKLVRAASAALDTPEDDIVRWFGRTALPLLVVRFPAFFEKHTSTRPFLLTLNDVIHPEVRKLFPGSYAPEFEFETSKDGEELRLGYLSHRNLCSFGEGLIEGSAEHFGEIAEISQSSCTKRGDEKCVFVCRFSPAG